MLLSLLIAISNFLLVVAQAQSAIDPDDWFLPLPQRANENRANENNQMAYDYEFSLGPWEPSWPCHRAIHAILPCPTGPRGCRFGSIDSIYSALTHCPSVEEVNLYFGDGWCGEHHVKLYNYTLPITNEAKFPALKKLVLDGYRFGGPWMEEPQQAPEVGLRSSCEHDWNEAQTLAQNLRRESTRQNDHTSLATWLEAMDWEQLEELSINWARNPEEVLVKGLAGSGKLKNLKTLEITSRAFVQALDNNTLTELTWVGHTGEGELEIILAHQGRSLRKLEYRCDELACPEFPRSINISRLSELAPKLEHISINIPRNGSLPFSDLKSLARMPNLQTADLFLRMQSDCHAKEEALGIAPDWSRQDNTPDAPGVCSGLDRYQLPYLNHTTAEDMFAYVRNQKQGLEMKAVTFWTGDWSSNPQGNSYMSWQRAKVTCTAEGSKSICEAENPKYYGDEWGRNFYKSTAERMRQRLGDRITDKQLLGAVTHERLELYRVESDHGYWRWKADAIWAARSFWQRMHIRWVRKKWNCA